MLPTFSDMAVDGFFSEQTPPQIDECELYIPAVHIAERGEQ